MLYANRDGHTPDVFGPKFVLELRLIKESRQHLFHKSFRKALVKGDDCPMEIFRARLAKHCGRLVYREPILRDMIDHLK